MNISKLNPIGYEATTEKGNKYKKSNTWTYVAIGSTLSTYTIPQFIKNPTYRAMTEEMLSHPKSLLDLFEKISAKSIPQKYEKSTLIGIGALIAILNIIGGRVLDNITNKKRVKKADELNKNT